MRDITFCGTPMWPTCGPPVRLKKGKLRKNYPSALFGMYIFENTEHVFVLAVLPEKQAFADTASIGRLGTLFGTCLTLP